MGPETKIEPLMCGTESVPTEEGGLCDLAKKIGVCSTADWTSRGWSRPDG